MGTRKVWNAKGWVKSVITGGIGLSVFTAVASWVIDTDRLTHANAAAIVSNKVDTDHRLADIQDTVHAILANQLRGHR